MSPGERQRLDYLNTFLTPERRMRFEDVLARRTRWLTVVLEDVYQPLNSSAVLRTAEAMGLQDVHVIESTNRFVIDRNVTMGSDRWLTIHRHVADPSANVGDATRGCLEQLRSEGFRILAACPHPPAKPLAEVVVEGKTALLLGHETKGLSPDALECADEQVVIPIRGFVESFNLSVAAAICLSHLRQLYDASGLDGRLTADEADALRLAWARLSIPNVQAVESRLEEHLSGTGR